MLSPGLRAARQHKDLLIQERLEEALEKFSQSTEESKVKRRLIFWYSGRCRWRESAKIGLATIGQLSRTSYSGCSLQAMTSQRPVEEG